MAEKLLSLNGGLKKVEETMGKSFSDEQKKVITHYGKPLNVIACAGAGKTTVSIAHMLMLEMVHGVKPYNILSITFSKKASDEISTRYLNSRSKFGDIRYKPTFKTFHALFLMLLKTLPEYRDYQVADANEFKYGLFKDIKSNGLRDKNDVFTHYLNVRSAVINKGLSKDGVQSIDKYINFDKLGFDLSNYTLVMTKYKEQKQMKRVFDFEDMQVLLLEALENGEPELVEKFQKAYSHIILDEYQDISPIQDSILNLLLSPKQVKGLMAIGDDDQSIYGFRGSEPKYIIDFIYNYVNAKRYYLSTNYRCKSNILDEIKPSISKNTRRVDKPLTTFKEGGKVRYLDISDKTQKNHFLDELKADLNGGDSLSDTAVLVRFNNQRVLLADELAEDGIPVDISSEKYLLSNTSVYKNIMSVIKMVQEGNGFLFKKNHFKIARHLSTDVVDLYVNFPEKDWYADAIAGRLNFHDKALANFKAIHGTNSMYELILGAWKILLPNYREMSKKGFINLDNAVNIVHYMLNLCVLDDGTSIDLTTFEKAETYKKDMLVSFIGEKDAFKIFTMHSVKGLEFKKVYLYGLTEKMVSKEVLRGHANEFELDKIGELGLTDEFQEMEVMEAMNQIFDYSVSLEEERRVFYVACTRAEEELILCYDSSAPLALLDEMPNYVRV